MTADALELARSALWAAWGEPRLDTETLAERVGAAEARELIPELVRVGWLTGEHDPKYDEPGLLHGLRITAAGKRAHDTLGWSSARSLFNTWQARTARPLTTGAAAEALAALVAGRKTPP